jgi:ribosomal protein S18 acetylase RimI-like enzyme
MSGHYFLNRLRNEVAQRGIWGLCKKILNRIATFFYYSTSSVWYERNLEEPIHHFPPDIAVKTEFLDHDKTRFVEWLRDNKSKYPWIYFEKEVDAALKYDHVVLLMTHQDLIIGYVKIGVGHTYIHDFDQILEFQPGTAFVYDTFTLPDYRGKSLALFALNQASEYFKARNFERILCHIEGWNVPSIKTFEKAGFRARDSIRFIRMARFSFFVRGGCIPFFNLEKYLSRLGTNE